MVWRSLLCVYLERGLNTCGIMKSLPAQSSTMSSEDGGPRRK